MTVIQQAQHMFKKSKRPPRKEEVIGAWGELKFSNYAYPAPINVLRETSKAKWLGGGGDGRDIIDFRYPHFEEGWPLKPKPHLRASSSYQWN